MQRFFISCAVLGCVLGCLATAGRAAIVTISPIDSASESPTGSSYVLDTGSNSLNASRFTSGLQRRGIMEFSLSGIAVGATINSAIFDYSINSFTTNSPPPRFPVIEFHGYSGNGVMEPADATRPFNLIGTSPTINALSPLQTSFSTTTLQSVVNSGGSHFGVFTYQQTIDLQGSFYSTDATFRPATDLPRLTVNYTPVPEPTAGAAIAFAAAAMLRRRRV